MKKLLVISIFAIVFPIAIFGQKGIDKQTNEITDKTDGNKTRNDTAQTFSWGKGKTKIREKLANPYQLNARRDILIDTIVDLLKDRGMIVDEAASRFKDGLIVTQPFTFSKGVILTKPELGRYAVLNDSYSTWTRGRFTLTIDVQSLDGVKNNVSVTANVEGRSGDGLYSQWTTLQSSGAAEDEFLAELVKYMSGDLADGERKP